MSTFTYKAMFKANKTPVSNQVMILRYAGVDPDTLRGDPQELKNCLYWQEEGRKEAEKASRSIYVDPGPTLATKAHHTPAAMQNTINQATSNNTMTGQQPAPAPAPKSTSIRVYNNRPQASPPPVTKSAGKPDLVTPQLYTGQIVWMGPGGSTLTKVEEPAPAPTLPVSIYTGKPSQLAAASRGLPSAWLPQYEVDRQVGQGQAQKSMVVSPITGQPSTLTAQIRKSVGIND